MKKLFSFILLSTIFVSLTAQDINISFQPAVSGTNIDSIWVTNQRSNEKVKLLGNESLTLTKVTSANDIPFTSDEGFIYPNPCNGKAELCFATSMNQEVKVNVYNISGQLLSTKNQFLMPGQHRFKILFPETGIYNVSVLKSDGSIYFKAVCNGPTGTKCAIICMGSEYQNLAKSAVVGKTLKYGQGDILHCSAFSGKNNTIIADSPKATKVYSVEFYECIDPNKKSYKVVKIGNQVWMAENLAFKTNSGSYVYDNNETNVEIYGRLYDWYTAKTACPTGWHLPNDSEWTILTDYLTNNGYGYQGSGNDIAKSMASQTNWHDHSTLGTPGVDLGSNNSSGFSVLPGGYRTISGCFQGLVYESCLWSSSEDLTNNAWYRFLFFGNTQVERTSFFKEASQSVRCIWD
jgi:uncharacterized protein (TIGR02145 family)